MTSDGVQSILSLAVNPNLLCTIMVNGSNEEKENLFEVACRFLEDRLINRPNLKHKMETIDLDHTTYKLERGIEFAGTEALEAPFLRTDHAKI